MVWDVFGCSMFPYCSRGGIPPKMSAPRDLYPPYAAETNSLAALRLSDTRRSQGSGFQLQRD
jgi:hypothetical protein